MRKLSEIRAFIKDGIGDTRVRILVLIAAFGLFTGMLAAVGTDYRRTGDAYYHDSSYGYMEAGVKLVETPVSTDPSSADAPAEPSERVDINTASVYELAGVLPGIGEKKAQAIIEYRELTGGFSSVDELIEVSGIGEKLLEQIRPYCYVAETSDGDAAH